MMADPSSGKEVVARLIHPLPLEDFIHRHWQSQLLVINRESPEYFHDILTIENIDELLSTRPIPAIRVHLGKDAVGVPADAYIARGDQGDGTYVRPSDVLRLHKQGNTIILRTMHLFLEKLGTLCEATEAFFHCSAQANIYVTPENTQSSYPHWDAHDIFVLQIAGTKRWRLHASEVQQPLYTYRFDPARHEVGPQVDEFTLHAGDIAYLPRGMAHNPVAEGYSVHIALGVLVKTWADVFAEMFESVVLNDPECRRVIPVLHGRHGFDVEQCLAEFPAIAEKFLAVPKMHAALERLSHQFLRTRRSDTRHMLTQFANKTPVVLSTIVELPAHTFAVVERRGGNCRVVFNGLELVVDEGLQPALEYIRLHRRVCVSEIPSKSDAHRVALAQRLVDEGALRVCENAQ